MNRSYPNRGGRSTKSQPKTQSEQRNGDAETQSNGATENQSFKGNGVSDDTHDSDERPSFAVRICSLQDAAAFAISDKSPGDPVFKFARAVKAFEMTTDARLPTKELPGAFGFWWALAKPTLPPETDREECLFLFVDAFAKAKTPLGSNVINNAIESLAKTAPPPEAERYESRRIKRLVHLCHELQKICGEGPFFLSVRDAARAIGCERFETAGTFLKGLVGDGILEAVELGKPGIRRASRFRFVRQKTAQ